MTASIRVSARRVCAMLAACTALTACVVVPHPRDVVQLARVEGRISSARQPVAGVRLTMNSVWNLDPCEEPIASVRTGEDGAFAFDEITTRAFWRLVVLAPSSPTYSMTLCMEDDSGMTPIFDRRIWATLPLALSLQCDLPKRDDRDDSCEVVDWTGYNFIQDGSNPHFGRFRPRPISTPGKARRQ